LRRALENPWVRHCLKKNTGKTKWKGGEVFTEPLGGVENLSRVCGEGCFKTLKEYCENFLAGSAG
jgi:hypothetical protein